MTAVILVPVLIVTLLVGGAIVIYNALTSRRLEAENAWAHIDVQLRRRHDLIPNLVEVVKGYAGHERDTLEKVAQARNIAAGAAGRTERAAAENDLAGPLARLFLLAEAYPQLKADVNFQRLHEELRGTENRVSFARQYYNDSVNRLNSLVERFPANLVAGLCGFRPAEYFRLAANEAAVPAVAVRS
jgi:LemA protein